MVKRRSVKNKDIKMNKIASQENNHSFNDKEGGYKPMTIAWHMDNQNEYYSKNKAPVKSRNTPPRATRMLRSRTCSSDNALAGNGYIGLDKVINISENLFNTKPTLDPQCCRPIHINDKPSKCNRINSKPDTKSNNDNSNRICASFKDRRIVNKIKTRQQTRHIPSKLPRETSSSIRSSQSLPSNKLIKSGKKPLFQYSSDNARIIGPAKTEDISNIKTYPKCKKRDRIRTASINEHVDRYRRGISPKMRIGPRTYLEMQKKKAENLRYSMYPTPPYMYMYKERYCDLLKNNNRVKCITIFTNYIKNEWENMTDISKEKYYQMASEVYEQDKNLLFPEIREFHSDD